MGWSVLAPAGFDRMGIEFPACRGVFPLVRGLPIVDFITTRYIGSIPAGTGVGGGVKWAALGCWAADGFRCHPGRMGHVVPEFLSFAIFSPTYIHPWEAYPAPKAAGAATPPYTLATAQPIIVPPNVHCQCRFRSLPNCLALSQELFPRRSVSTSVPRSG